MQARPDGRKRAFSLVELIIVVVIIGIISAIAIPKMSRGARNAGANTLSMDLSVLRNALELYAAEHDGKFPDAGIGTQLTQYTDMSGLASLTKDPATGRVFGPYLKEIPPLPVGSKKGARDIVVDTIAGSLPTGAGSEGWWYNSADTIIRANLSVGAPNQDDDGVDYNTY